ncbi:hypothetical protein NDU88_007873 [Pleurodeles waltl]|uniref:Uncharacterized protein n=1 Tax=Pleurodeles waltl TaxID=8319 RepID=A0AAV7RT49_PLEWA|nr:hypothetical protein NDU88_007873 [Pleurodeles waltl]
MLIERHRAGVEKQQKEVASKVRERRYEREGAGKDNTERVAASARHKWCTKEELSQGSRNRNQGSRRSRKLDRAEVSSKLGIHDGLHVVIKVVQNQYG